MEHVCLLSLHSSSSSSPPLLFYCLFSNSLSIKVYLLNGSSLIGYNLRLFPSPGMPCISGNGSLSLYSLYCPGGTVDVFRGMNIPSPLLPTPFLFTLCYSKSSYFTVTNFYNMTVEMLKTEMIYLIVQTSLVVGDVQTENLYLQEAFLVVKGIFPLLLPLLFYTLSPLSYVNLQETINNKMACL